MTTRIKNNHIEGLGALDNTQLQASYRVIKGFAHQRYVACPPCGPQLVGVHSTKLGKHCISKSMKVVTSWPPYITDGMKAHFDGQLEFWNKHVIVNVEKQLKGVVEMKAKLELDGPSKGHEVK